MSGRAMGARERVVISARKPDAVVQHSLDNVGKRGRPAPQEAGTAEP